MKKILFLLTSVLAVFGLAGCAEEETPAPVVELSYEEKINKINVNDITEEEAVYMTVQSLYNVPELSENVKQSVIQVYEGLQTGKIFGEEGPVTGMGEVKHPAIASAVFQSLFKTVSVSNSDNLTKLLSYDALDNQTIFQEAMTGIITNTEDFNVIQNFVNNFARYVISSQDNIVNISKEYVTLLLDSSSSASKTAGGGGVVSAQEYLVSANIAYAFSDIAIRGQIALNFDAKKYPEKVKFLANTLYNFSEETKLRITYDKSLVYFNTNDAIAGLDSPYGIQIVKSVLNDINTTTQLPGGSPYPSTYVLKVEDNGTLPTVIPDAAVATNPYYQGPDGTLLSADEYIYKTVGSFLLASPAGNNIYLGSDYSPLTPTNMVNNNMLDIYQRLKLNGLKAPLITSKIGAEALAAVIAKYLRDAGIVYLTSNVDATSNSAGFSNFQLLAGALFVQDTTTGEIPACALIREYNKTIDDAAISSPYNQGFYTREASGSLCGIYIDDTERKDFNAADYGY